jgi:ATP-binding cassette subfamily F protein 3
MDVVIVKPAHADRSNPDEIRISEFSMSFSGRVLLNNAGLYIQKGRRYGLIGRNGVGKSTLLRHIARGSFNLMNSPDILFIEQEVPGNEATPLEWVLAADVKRTEMLKEEQKLLGLIESTPAAFDGDKEEAEKLKKSLEENGKENEDEGDDLPSPSPSPNKLPLSSKKGKKTVVPTSSLSSAITSAAARTREEDTSSALMSLYDRMSNMDFSTQEARARGILRGLGFGDEDMVIPSKKFSGGWRMRISLARALFREPTFLFLDEPV